MDVDHILKVPLCDGVTEDECMWFGNDECVFKVKDAYKIARMMEDHASSS